MIRTAIVSVRASSALRLAAVSVLLASVAGTLGKEATLDLQAWFGWLQERPRIRELVARRTDADGVVSYMLFVRDGDNYVVKLAPNEKLLRARVLTPKIEAAGHCGDEFWTVSGRIPPMQDLRLVRERDLSSTNRNFVGLAQVLNYAMAQRGFAFLRLGDSSFFVDPRRDQGELRLTGDGFEFRGHDGSGGWYTNRVVLESVEQRDGRLHCRLTRTVTGGGNAQGRSTNYRGLLEAEFEPGSFIPSNWRYYSLDKGKPQLALTVERLSLELSDSPLPLRLFRPELYVLQGFPMVMRLEGDQVVTTPAHDSAWRKVVLFGHVFSYRVVKWAVIALIAAITVVAVIVVRNQHRKHPKEKLS